MCVCGAGKVASVCCGAGKVASVCMWGREGS